MDGLWLCVALAALFCAVSSSQEGISGMQVQLRIRPGDNIILYCDCDWSTGVDIVWFRNCSHDNQPNRVMSTAREKDSSPVHGSSYDNVMNPFPGFKLVFNKSNNTYDLLIENMTESKLGLYYCGTVEMKLAEGGKESHIYHYGNVRTRLSFELLPECPVLTDCDEDCSLSWLLVLLYRVMLVVLLPFAYWVGTLHGGWRRRQDEVQKRRRN